MTDISVISRFKFSKSELDRLDSMAGYALKNRDEFIEETMRGLIEMEEGMRGVGR